VSRVRFCVFETGGDILKKIVDLTDSFNMRLSKVTPKKMVPKNKNTKVSTGKAIRKRRPRKRYNRETTTVEKENENSDDATSHDESASVISNVQSGGNAVASGGKADNDAGEDDTIIDSRKHKSATKSSSTGTSNKSDDSSKCASKSGENDCDKDARAKRTEGIVEANDDGYQSVVLSNKKSDDQENEEKKNSNDASSHDESASVKTNVKSGGECGSKLRQRFSQIR
jgi:hypothetical protein